MTDTAATPASCPACGGRIGHHDIVLAEGIIALGGHEAHLTPQQSALTAKLLDKVPLTVSKNSLYDALYGAETDPENLPDPKIIDVIICAIRRKLAPLGLKIETSWGVGYRLTTAEADKADALSDATIQRQATRSGLATRLTDDDTIKIKDLRDRGWPHTAIARELKISYRTVYRHIQKQALAS